MCWINSDLVAQKMPVLTDKNTDSCWIVLAWEEADPETHYVLGNPKGNRVLGFSSKEEADNLAKHLATHTTVTSIEFIEGLEKFTADGKTILELTGADTKH